MELIIKNSRISQLNLAREIGYTITPYSQTTELNFVRTVGKNPYPRFHIYIKKQNQDYIISLHLDQKKSSYKGFSTHNAEYTGRLIEEESERIKTILKDDTFDAFSEHNDQMHEHI
ncbi:MAG: hypothetical protein PHN37_01530 [Candidatus Pacebacteria bacterium]|nr:hypothetical protein [Candidatus Paceibacterota bacterium]